MNPQITETPVRSFETYIKNISDETLRTAFREYLDQKETGSYRNAVTIQEIRNEYINDFGYRADYDTVTKVILQEIATRWYKQS